MPHTPPSSKKNPSKLILHGDGWVLGINAAIKDLEDSRMVSLTISQFNLPF